MKTDPLQTAFPCQEMAGCAPEAGLTKREYFAGLAMQGILAYDNGYGYTETEAADYLGIQVSNYNCVVHWPIFVAKMAVEQAEALIAALNKGESSVNEA